MQDFNQLSSLWQSQGKMPPMASAEEMLHAIKTHVLKMKQKNRFNIIVLVCAALVFIGCNLFFGFKWTTHLGLALIALAIVSAIIQYLQLQKILSNIDYSQDNTSFITQFKQHQQKRLKLYQGYYWWYLILLILGMGMCIFELSTMYSNLSICILISCTTTWIILCSVWVRKLTLEKIKEEYTLFLEKLEE